MGLAVRRGARTALRGFDRPQKGPVMSISHIPSSTTLVSLNVNQRTYILLDAAVEVASGTAVEMTATALSSLIVAGRITATNTVDGAGILAVATSIGTRVSVTKTGLVESGNVGVWLKGAGQVLENFGHIKVTDTSGHGVAVDGTSNAQVVNHGAIKGGSAAMSAGVAVSTSSQVLVENDGRITGNLGIYGFFSSQIDITNSGKIVAAGTGVVLSSLVDAGQLHNFGLIRGGENGVHVAAGTSEIVNMGTIKGGGPMGGGAILYDSGDNDLTNGGRIVGPVQFDAGADTFHALPGSTLQGTLWMGGGNDTVIAAEQDDIVFGEAGNDDITGGGGNDELHGGAGDDTLKGSAGADKLFGDAGNDLMLGGGGKDRLNGGVGIDILKGEGGADRLNGGDGIDVMLGGGGKDRLNGGLGDDQLDGGKGNDVLTGSSGSDTFIFNAADANTGRDRITDFLDGVDKIDLTSYAIADYDFFLGAAKSMSHGNTVIDLSAAGAGYSGLIVLEGVNAAQITAGDFV
ncbi:MAG: calcium-binding protein [Alphaproteobacteria bacterium]|nr:MAG: calcium-binding protein [Alphaproteobacteria bacterium]